MKSRLQRNRAQQKALMSCCFVRSLEYFLTVWKTFLPIRKESACLSLFLACGLGLGLGMGLKTELNAKRFHR